MRRGRPGHGAMPGRTRAAHADRGVKRTFPFTPGMTERAFRATSRAMPDARVTSEPAGLAARRIAADILDGVLRRQRPLDEQIDGANLSSLPERDRALTRA